MTSHESGHKGESTTPEGITATSTPTSPQLDHSFTLQAVMELQKSVGELTSTINGVKESINRQERKLESMEEKLSAISHKVYAALAIALLLVTLSGYILDKAWDIVAKDFSISQQNVEENIKIESK